MDVDPRAGELKVVTRVGRDHWTETTDLAGSDHWRRLAVDVAGSAVTAAVSESGLSDDEAVVRGGHPEFALAEAPVNLSGFGQLDNLTVRPSAEPVTEAVGVPEAGAEISGDEFTRTLSDGWDWVREDEIRNFQQAGLMAYAADDDSARLGQVAIWNTRQTEYAREQQAAPDDERTIYGAAAVGTASETIRLRLAHRVAGNGEHHYLAGTSTDGKSSAARRLHRHRPRSDRTDTRGDADGLHQSRARQQLPGPADPP